MKIKNVLPLFADIRDIIDPIFEGLVSGTIKSLEPTEVVSIGVPPSRCFFQYNDLDPDTPAQVRVYCRSLAYHSGDISMLNIGRLLVKGYLSYL